MSGKLNNKSFVDKAPEEVVSRENVRKTVLESEISGLQKNLEEL